MRSRGWLEQAEYDVMTLIDQADIYDHGLPIRRQAARTNQGETDPRSVAAQLLELYYMENIEVREDKIDADSDLRALLAAGEPPSAGDMIVGLFSEGTARLGGGEG